MKLKTRKGLGGKFTKSQRIEINKARAIVQAVEIFSLDRDIFIDTSHIEKVGRLQIKLDEIYQTRDFNQRVKTIASFNSRIINGRIVIPNEPIFIKSKIHFSAKEYAQVWTEAKNEYNQLIDK